MEMTRIETVKEFTERAASGKASFAERNIAKIIAKKQRKGQPVRTPRKRS